MNIGKACAIFEQIKSDKYAEQEKLQAIKEVIAMPTHNGIRKDEIIGAFRWFFEWAIEEASTKQTNADKVRNMTDEELAEILFSDCMDAMGDSQCIKFMCDCEKCILAWLQSEAEE